MKNLIFTFALVFIALFNVTAQTTSYVSYRTTTTTTRSNTFSLQTKVAAAVSLLSAKGYTIIDHTRKMLKAGQTYSGGMYMTGGRSYSIIAVSESGVYDLDMELIDSDYDKVSEDNDAGDKGLSVIEGRMPYSDYFTIKVKNYEAASSTYPYDIVLIVAVK